VTEPVGGPRSKTSRDPDLSPEQIVELLRANPAAIAAATADLDDATLARDPAPGEWSAVTILAHLRACADQWGGACLAILAADRPTIRAIGPRSWVKRTDYATQPFSVSFATFLAQRKALLAVLEPLPVQDWSRSAIVTGAGPVMERTLTWYALGLADHERQHVRQVERLAAGLGAHRAPPSRRAAPPA
jgi:hypothetical protein